VLCKANFPELKSIELNNNGISVNGVSHLVNNKWNDKVTYNLDTVKTTDNGYAFKIGESIPTMKKMVTLTPERL
jgi:hypothetical protein